MKKKYFFNQFFGITDKNPEHLNVRVNSDIEVFIDPFLISNNKSSAIAANIQSRNKNFLTYLNKNFVVPGDRKKGITFLSDLNEANEFKLGYSLDNKGKGIGAKKAEVIYDSLHNNKFARKGVSITNEAENVLLLVNGIGQDNMSDTIANVCRDIFADFTLAQCMKYSIKVYDTDIRYYNDVSFKWETKSVKLPYHNGEPIILIPRFIASGSRDYQSRYNWFLSRNYWARDIMNGTIKFDSDNTNYTYTKKDGTKEAIIKNINKAFKKPKSELIDCVVRYPDSLINFRDYAKLNYLCVQYESLMDL